ncbi:MAG: hypothetical protein ACREPT_01725 [Rudaea sp.]
MNKFNVIILGVFVSMLGVTNAYACGESMFHSGQGMRYHAFITRQPAEILIYRSLAPDPDASRKELYSGLQRAGHKVTIVTDSGTLAQALTTKKYDVIIAGTRDMQTVEAQLDKSQHAPALLAVLGPDAVKDASIRQHFPHNLREDDGLNQYLKSIEQTMQTRGT